MTAQSIRRKPAAQRRTAAAPVVNAAVVDAAEARDGLRVVALAQRQAFERLERLREEGLRFATTRLEENRSVLRELVQTPNLPDRLTIWSRYVERTMKQYSENFGTFAGICRDQLRESVQDGADAAQAAAAALAEVTPSPMAELAPPLPGAEPEAEAGTVAEAAAETGVEAAPDVAAEAAPEVTPESPTLAESVPAGVQRH